MNPYAPWPRTARIALVLFIIVTTGFILREAEQVLVPLVLAVLVSFLLHPLVKRLHRLGLNRVVAVLLVVGAATLLMGGLGFVVSSQIKSLADDIPNHRGKIEERVLILKKYFKGGTVDRLAEMVSRIDTTTERIVDNEAARLSPDGTSPADVPIVPPMVGQPDQQSPTSSTAKPEAESPPAATTESDLSDHLTSWLSGGVVLSAFDLLANAGIVLLLTIFFLIQQADIRDRFVIVAGRGALATTTKALEDAGSRISRYLLMQFAINAAFGLSVTLGLAALQVPYALMWGLCGALFRYVPYVGAWIAAVLPIATSLMIFDGWTVPICVFLLFLILDLICGNVLEPILYGHSVGLSEVGVILAAIAWAWIWGPIGLVLATPMTAMLVVLGKYVPGLRLFDYLLGDRPPVGPAVRLYQRLLAKDDEDAEELIREHLKDHSLLETADQLLVPALELLHQDLKGERIDEDSAAWIQAMLENHIAELDTWATQPDAKPRSAKDSAEVLGPEPVSPDLPVVVGVAAHAVEEGLVLQILQQSLANTACRFEIVSSDLLMSERIAKSVEHDPVAICISAMPPGDLPFTRQLCKRLRARSPEVKLLVGRWTPDTQGDREHNLKGAGADEVIGTVAEMARRIDSIVQVQHAGDRAAKALSNPAPAQLSVVAGV